jgi:hypothetical protein
VNVVDIAEYILCEICTLLGYYVTLCGNCGKQLPHDAA